jgi:hypothetical protein
MQRREYLAGVIGISTVTTAGCLGNGSGPDEGQVGTPTSNTEAAEHIDSAAESFTQAAQEFNAPDAAYQNLRTEVTYDRERVRIALEDGRSELDAARELEMSANQETYVEYLSLFADAVEGASVGYDAFLAMLEHLDLADSYRTAARREDADQQVVEAQLDRESAAEGLTKAADSIRSMRSMTTELDTELSMVDWRQRVEQTATVVRTWQPTLVGYAAELSGRWAYNDTKVAIEDNEYETAIERSADAMTSFGKAQSKFRDGEEVAETTFRQTLITWGCQMSNYQSAAEHLQAAALEYQNGSTRNGNDEVQAANADVEKSC